MISLKCATEILKDGHDVDMEVAFEWIAVREYIRVNAAPADVEAWDNRTSQAWNAYNGAKTTEERGAALQQWESVITEEQKTFISNIKGLLKSPASVPGLDSDKCMMDWGEFACFCNWAAALPPGQLVSLANAVTEGQKIPYQCVDAIRNDVKYDGDWPKPTPDTSAKKSWTPWIVAGVATVAVVGGVVWYNRRRS